MTKHWDDWFRGCRIEPLGSATDVYPWELQLYDIDVERWIFIEAWSFCPDLNVLISSVNGNVTAPYGGLRPIFRLINAHTKGMLVAWAYGKVWWAHPVYTV